jgi:hypothetical protein
MSKVKDYFYDPFTKPAEGDVRIDEGVNIFGSVYYRYMRTNGTLYDIIKEENGDIYRIELGKSEKENEN